MKNKIFILLVLPMMFAFMNGCKERLEIEPRQSLSDQAALTTLGGLENALTGAYNDLQDDDLMGADYIQCAELFTDQIQWGGSFTSYTQVAVKAMTTDNTEPRDMWNDGYQAINSANKIIEAIENDNVSGADYEAAKDRILGSALFIRAVAHFQLVSFFGQASGFSADNSHLGVPVVTTPTNSLVDATFKPVRYTVAEVYAQVISDLQQVEALSPEVNDGRATSWAATAFLSKVYMQLHDWTNAAAKANEVIQSGAFSLGTLDSYSTDFAPNGIFEIHMVSDDNLSSQNNALNDYWSPVERGDITVDAAIPLYDAADARLTWFFQDGGAWWSEKYMDASWNVTILRYEEMIMNRAEALAMLNNGSDAEAVTLLNQIKTRANLPIYVYVDNASLVIEIQDETVKEFIHEGHAFLDYKRWRKTDIGYASGAAGTVSWDYEQNIFPIPQDDRDVNENLEQNPGF